MTSALAINIGITGHRDIPDKDLPALEQALEKELSSLKQRFPNSTINVLCGMAPGADQLAASVAFSLDLPVIAVLPFSQQEYEKDFSTEDSLHTFRSMLAKCHQVRPCLLSQQTLKEDRNQGYAALGRTLVKCSDTVLALWDGIIDEKEKDALTKTGGTADVVRMCVEGLIDDDSILFSKPNKTYCKWLVTNRSKHSHLPKSINSETNIGLWKPVPLAGNQDIAILDDILNKTEKFNLEAKKLSKQQKQKSITYMMGDESAVHQYEDIAKLIDVYSIADNLAQSRQRQRETSTKVITSLSLLAIAAQQVYAGLSATIEWFVAHIALVALILLVYRLFFYGSNSREEQYVELRVFAEDLRVQIYWYIAGLGDHCANNYRTTKLYEMDWIVDNLNKLMFLVDPPQSKDIEFVRNNWIVDQRNYFFGQKGERGRAAQLMKQAKAYTKHSVIYFVFAIALMFFSAIKIHYGLFSYLSDNGLLLIVAMAFVMSAILKTYSSQMGYEELSQRYLRTGYFFQQALKRMTVLDEKSKRTGKPDTAAYQRVIKVIGVEALNENAAWLQLHRMNAYQVQIN